MPDHNHAPAWLFAFVDLAFLLIIAMTQVGVDDASPDFGEISVPKIRTESADALPARFHNRWQLRVYPPVADGTGPFELSRNDDADVGPKPSDRLELAGLERRLASLKGGGEGRPLLAPHEDSLSQDLLAAANAIENQWPRRRRVAVIPLAAEVANR
ncbi:MAG: hypothetical protein HKP27_01580 [Myxococcales bacterium]|nr:hypothetical protein [Myxococcales bacterium]